MRFSQGRRIPLVPAALVAAAAVAAGAFAASPRPAPAARLAAASVTIQAARAWSRTAQPGPDAALAGLASSTPVVVSCEGKDQVQPAGYVIACADGNAGLQRMHWQVWGTTAYGTGTMFLNDCYPNCAEGKFYHFPVLAVLWRPQPQPGHASRLYFSRLSTVYSGAHCLPWPPAGQSHCLPVNFTYDLLGRV